MFAQMMSNQMGNQDSAPNQTVQIPRYVDDRVSRAPTLGKRTAQDELDHTADSDHMVTGDSDTTRKRIDQRQTPEKPSNPSATTHTNVPDLVPHRLMLESPRHVPLPASPTDCSQQQPSLPSKTSATSTAASSHPAITIPPAQYQQQSMSRYLRLDQTGMSIQDPPPISRVQISASQNHASLSEAEDALLQSSSGNESKEKTPRSSHDPGESPNHQS